MSQLSALLVTVNKFYMKNFNKVQYLKIYIFLPNPSTLASSSLELPLCSGHSDIGILGTSLKCEYCECFKTN